MRAPPGSGDASPSRSSTPTTPARQLEALHQGFRTRLQPLLAKARDAAERELRQTPADERSEEHVEALANAVVLRHEAIRQEQRWSAHLARGFAGWPKPAGGDARTRAFSLVSEGELHAQLIGQPAVEQLERRFANVLDIIDGRLWSLAAAFGTHERPVNPFAPRALIDAFLDTFSPTECDRLLRPVMLRHYERLCGPCLLDAYAWLNSELAEAGHALDGASAGTALVSQPIAGGPSQWPGHDALEPENASWRDPRGKDAGGEGKRWKRLRERLRARRGDVGHGASRDLSDQEFVSVLSLVQGNETPPEPVPVPGAIGDYLRDALAAGAEGLGLPRELAGPSPRQCDAIEAVGALFDGLRVNTELSPGADARLARLAWPWLRLALEDVELFEDAGHPAMRVLCCLAECWDANPGDTEDEAGLHALADRVADTIANDYHGDAAVFGRALAELDAGRTRLQRRADITARRAWQAILGSERLQAARRHADALLAPRLRERPLPVPVADFLSGPWRQALVMAWLREGPDADRMAARVELGDALLRVEEAASAAEGTAVAEGLIALDAGLRACHADSGEDPVATDEAVARLVAALARPDTPRVPAVFMPLADEGEDAAPDPGTTGAPRVDRTGQVVLGRRPDDGRPRWLRIAWTSPETGRHLLVNRQGVRQALVPEADLVAALARGDMVARPKGDLVDGVLRRLAGEAQD